MKKLKSIGQGLCEDIRNRWCEMKARKLHTMVTILVSVVVILGLTALVIYDKGLSYFQQSNYVEDTTEVVVTEVEQPVETDPELLAIQKNIERYSQSEPITTDGRVYNILLVGVDRTSKTENGNSDSMILISLNYEREQISMISLMRDTYVQIPGVGYRKLNAAYATGGGQLLAETVTENFKIQVDRYMAVSFRDMANIIDTIGGVTLSFTEKEAANANKSLTAMCKNMKLSEQLDDYLIPGEGTYPCNGLQTVAYARIRKVGNADYQRTERQREVLTKLFEKVKRMSIDDIDRLGNELLPMITHNIPENEFWRLLGKAPAMMKYDLVQERIPYDGMFRTQNENLIPHWEATIERLKKTLYTWTQSIQSVEVEEDSE